MYLSNINVDTSSSNSINHSPFLFNNNIDATNSNISKLDEDQNYFNPSNFSLFQFPNSPFMHYEDDSIFLQHLQELVLVNQQQELQEQEQEQPLMMRTETNLAETTATATTLADRSSAIGNTIQGCSKRHDKSSVDDDEIQIQMTKRFPKKDRHSKINTANGPRDRRMRLSLDVARKFFDLQDMLGFDKASKTVEWLLTRSRTAIKDLAKGLGLPYAQNNMSCGTVGANYSTNSSTSECEVVSGDNDHESTNSTRNLKQSKQGLKAAPGKEKGPAKAARRGPFQAITRESRDKAREKARKRTIEKRKLSETRIFLQVANTSHYHEFDGAAAGSWGSLDACEESETCRGNNNESKRDCLGDDQVVLSQFKELNSGEQLHQRTGQDIICDANMIVASNWSPSAVFSFHQNSGIPQENNFTEFQFCGKLW